MIAGLPGTGIGGIFYILSVFLMPVIELCKTFSGRSSLRRWKFILNQMAQALGIMAGFWVTGWILGFMLHDIMVASHASSANSKVTNVLQTRPFLFSVGTLFVVIAILTILAFFCNRKPTRRENPGKNYLRHHPIHHN